MSPAHAPAVSIGVAQIDVLNFEVEGTVATFAGRFKPLAALLSDQARVVLSESTDFTSPLTGDYSAVNTTAAGLYCFKCVSPTLTAGTRYYWKIEVQSNPGGRVPATHYQPPSAPFVDVPPAGGHDFRLVAISCTSEKIADHVVHESIRSRVVDGDRRGKVIHLGDLTYSDYNPAGDAPTAGIQLNRLWVKTQNNPTGGETGAAQPYRTPLMWMVPWRYFPDDHDTGGDNASAYRFSGANDKVNTIHATLATYRAIVAHGTLNDANGVFQAWTEGRLRCYGLDSRYARKRSAEGDADDVTKTMLGATQLEWLLDEIEAAEADSDVLGHVIFTPSCWIGGPSDSDTWGQHRGERAWLANELAGNGSRPRVRKQIIMVGGDTHASKMDDGTNSDYSDGGSWVTGDADRGTSPVPGQLALANPMPYAQACSTNPPSPSQRGGPMSFDDPVNGGGLAEAGCMSEILVDDSGGDSLTLTLTNYQADSITGEWSVVDVGGGEMTQTFVLTLTQPVTVAAPVSAASTVYAPAVAIDNFLTTHLGEPILTHLSEPIEV